MGPEGPTPSEIVKPKLERLTAADIKVEVPKTGETSLILQCNAKDDRSANSPDIGMLIPTEAEAARDISYEHFKKLLGELSPQERQKVDILVLASEAKLKTETGIDSPHKRAVETGVQVISGLQQAMTEFSLPESQLLNTASAQEGEQPAPYEVSELRDLRMMEESPEFVQYLIEQEGKGEAWTGQGFWQAYEIDKYKTVREKMGVEGPLDIADRMAYFMTLAAHTSAEYHRTHPGRRLVIWANGHYDSMSPFLKKYVAMLDDSTVLDEYLPVDKKGGLTFKFDPEGKLSTNIKDQHIDLSQAV